MELAWLTSSKAKSLATLLPAVGSAIAIIIAALKPTGSEQSARAYDLMREELMAQRAEIREVHKSLVEVQVWMSVWREYQEQRAKNLEELRARAASAPASRPGRNPASVQPIPQIVEVEDLHENVPPPPKVGALPPPRNPLPPKTSLF